MENPNFLKKFKGLGNAPEVMKAKEMTEKRTGEKVKGDFESLVQNYLNRLTEFKDTLNQQKDFKDVLKQQKYKEIKERGAERFKHIIMDKFLTKYENIPDNYWKEKDEEGNMGPFIKEMNDQGQLGDWNRMNDEEKEKYKQEHAKVLIENQKGSLEEWADYFLSQGSDDIPDYLKYWIFRSVTGLQEYEKPKDWTKENIAEKKEGQFPRRSKNSLKKFPDLHPEALRYVTDAIEKKYQGQNHEFEYDIQPEEREKFQQYLEQENFAKLYAWAMELINPIPEQLLPITEGEWKKYPKGSNVEDAVKTLRGKGTGLCIAGKGAASNYLHSGDLHIFYSNDEEGKPVFPRIAIHAKDDKIAEMRGIAHKQNIDPFITDVASAKLAEFQNGKEYEKKTEDMKRLTEIETKSKQKQDLSKDDLIFLYEIDSPIQYFGMTKDPRIEEIRKNRNIENDKLTIFECEPNQIANKPEDINENTRVYIGELKSEIFELIQEYNIEYIYTSFPEGRIQKWEMELGIRTKDGIINELKERENAKGEDRIYMGDSGKSMLEKPEFFVQEKKEQAQFIKIKVRDLGFPSGATVKEIYEKAESLGLELCPPEAGPTIRLDYEKIFQKEQPRGEWFRIAMKQIADSGGDPDVFGVGRSDDGESWLGDGWAGPDSEWDAGYEVVFRLRKFET